MRTETNATIAAPVARVLRKAISIPPQIVTPINRPTAQILAKIDASILNGASSRFI